MRYLLLLFLILLVSCNDDLGMGEYPLDIGEDSLFQPHKSQLIVLPDSVDPVTSVTLITGSKTTQLMKQKNGFYLGSVTSTSYLGSYEFTLQIQRGIKQEDLTYYSSSGGRALYFLCSPHSGEIINTVTSTSQPKNQPVTVHNKSCTLSFSPSGTVQRFPGGNQAKWYHISGHPIKAVWGDSLEEYFWGYDDTLYQLCFEKNSLGEKSLSGYEAFTDTATVTLHLTLSTLHSGIIQASWQKENWPSTDSKLTLYLSANEIWDTTSALKYDVTHNSDNTIQIHNLQKGLKYRSQLVARERNGTLLKASSIVTCNIEKELPQSFELYGLAMTSNSITFRLPDLSFPDFESLTLVYTSGYITPTDATEWDTTFTVTNPLTETYFVSALTPDTEYTIAAYLRDKHGTEVLSKPYLIRLPEVMEQASLLELPMR